MSLSQNHQKLMKDFYPDFEVKEGEEGYFHILFVKVLPDGDRTKDNPMIQIFSGKDWNQFKMTVEKRGIKAVTQHNEYGIIYDPAEYEKAKAAELEKAEKEKAEKAKKEAEALAAFEKEKADKEALALALKEKEEKEAAELAAKKAAKEKVKVEAAEKKKAEASAKKAEEVKPKAKPGPKPSQNQ